MFAGDHYYKKGDTVTEGDTVIPIVEHEWNNLPLGEDDYTFLWDEYTWNGNVFEHVMEEDADDIWLINVASPGVGAAANSYLSLVNVEDSWIKIGRETVAESPGNGAYSPYYSREFFVRTIHQLDVVLCVEICLLICLSLCGQCRRHPIYLQEWKSMPSKWN